MSAFDVSFLVYINDYGHITASNAFVYRNGQTHKLSFRLMYTPELPGPCKVLPFDHPPFLLRSSCVLASGLFYGFTGIQTLQIIGFFVYLRRISSPVIFEL